MFNACKYRLGLSQGCQQRSQQYVACASNTGFTTTHKNCGGTHTIDICFLLLSIVKYSQAIPKWLKVTDKLPQMPLCFGSGSDSSVSVHACRNCGSTTEPLESVSLLTCEHLRSLEVQGAGIAALKGFH